MDVSVIVITKNQKHLIKRSLPLLLEQSFKGKHEIIVVDSGSTDGAREYIETLPVKLVKIEPEEFNFAYAFNLGAKHAKGRHLVRLSGDAIPQGKDFLAQLIKPFKNKKVGATYGKYVISGKKGYDYPNFWSEERFPEKETKYSIKPDPIKLLLDKKHQELVMNLAGGCCAIRKSIWEKRPFNEKLLGGEDGEYALFLHLAGFDIVCNPQAVVLHEHQIQKPRFRIEELKWRLFVFKEVAKLFIKSHKGDLLKES